ncbi:MAG TPA: type VI secretion system protein TssA [Gemmatimonadaceae bacterium]|nr:type VI secretion system protein TssA [Gemmatimonadaceae bacterium]
MPLRDDLLNPIAGDNPAGVDLRYDPIYDKIKEARREDDDAPQGEWQHARKVADWPLVIKLTGEVLATRSKDLQLAAWLGEAMLRREGFGSFRASLDMTRGLLEQFWDHLYPEIEDGDLEMRVAPLDWIGLKLEIPVKSSPMNRAGHSYFQYAEARSIGTEQEAADDTAKRAKREEAIAAKKPTIEDFDKAFAETPKAFVKQLSADLGATLASLQALDDAARAKFGDAAPSFRKLREVLEEEQRVASQLLAKKLEQDPDPVDAAPAAGDAAFGDGAASGAELGGAQAPRILSAEPVDRNDAASRVISASRFLRRTEPLSPASYLMLRALRWGELRAAGSNPDPKLLEAPTTQVRTQLRGLMLDSAWDQLLETSETVMGTAVGRGWLDLQRYTLTACQALGDDYAIVASSIRGELRAVLGAIPSLPQMTLMDDMPTATGPTLQWLRDEKIIGGEDDVADDGVAAAPLVSGEAQAREGRAGLERAASEVRAGRPEKAIELLMRALDREKTRRGRFLRQAELARIMVDAGFVQLAQPILQELMADIEAHKLDEWEAGDLVARPMALMYRCLEKLDGDSSMRHDLYTRIARLDPLQALGFGQG